MIIDMDRKFIVDLYTIISYLRLTILDLDIYLWFVRLHSEPHTQKLIINRFILVIISDVP